MLEENIYKELLNEKFLLMNNKIDSNQVIIIEKLSHILKENVKQDIIIEKNVADINKIKIDNIKHFNECPNTKKIDDIENELLEYRFIKKYPKLYAINIIAFLFGMGIYFYFK